MYRFRKAGCKSVLVDGFYIDVRFRQCAGNLRQCAPLVVNLQPHFHGVLAFGFDAWVIGLEHHGLGRQEAIEMGLGLLQSGRIDVESQGVDGGCTDNRLDERAVPVSGS